MRTRTATAAIAAALAVTLVGCSSTTEDKPASKPRASSEHKKGSEQKNTAAKPSGLTAKTASEQLADAIGVTTLGDPADNTGSCSNKAKGEKPNKNDCSQLVTTDTVSIYEFKTPAVAAHWVKLMKPLGDWRQVNRFALSWMARDQKLTSKERRTELVKALEKLTAQES